MKILLIAVNAKYIHSNLAVYSLKAYAEQQGEQVSLLEFTINQPEDQILRELYLAKPDVAAFSVYIWNVELIRQLVRDLHQILPETAVWLGGPEVSWDSCRVLEEFPFLSGILRGEGEESFRRLCSCYRRGAPEELSQVPGLVYRNPAGKLEASKEADLLEMDLLPFPYRDLQGFENRILYYESSRGCPFSCSYCLSSLERKMRYRSLDLVFRELDFFLEQKVRQVKFVDRTFNADRRRALAIWRFLRERDNGVTNFHFEIEADLLGEEEIKLLSSLRPGLVQLEIGVQTTNPRTLKAIRRNMDFGKLCRNVESIRKSGNIHQHLDLIAGLPLENLESFVRSFCQVYALHPQQLQLGFLKVLKGTPLAGEREEWGIRHKSAAPYEVLGTRWLAYGEILQLKLVEEMVEIYYNSGQFRKTLEAAEPYFQDPYSFYRKLGEFYEAKGLLSISHTRVRRYEILGEFFAEEVPEAVPLLRECMIFDLYARENLKARPAWAGEQHLPREAIRNFYEEEAKHPDILKNYPERDWRQLKSLTHLEEFRENLPGFPSGQKWLLFNYGIPGGLEGNARILDVTDRLAGRQPRQADLKENQKGKDGTA